ncbi:MAG: hypothetical protein KDB18_12385, partial [Salinibacterium sp.]|nr:hypothetical protein [Salinibacterium sp.]
ALIARVGAFDEAYFVYLEDIDLCLRARAAERACRYVPSAVMVHDASASSGGGYGAWRKHMVAYNLVLLLRRRGTPKLWMAFWVLEVLAWPLLFVSAAFRGRTRAALAKARGTWKALLHRPHERPVIPGAAS